MMEGKERTKRKTNPIRKMEENIMDEFKVFYDEEENILYLAKAGKEVEVVEISSGVNGA